jgi:hypothetical protein
MANAPLDGDEIVYVCQSIFKWESREISRHTISNYSDCGHSPCIERFYRV